MLFNSHSLCSLFHYEVKLHGEVKLRLQSKEYEFCILKVKNLRKIKKTKIEI